MSNDLDKIENLAPTDAARYVMDHDIADLFHGAEVVHSRRPAKMVTALRIDLDIHAELEAAAATRRVGVSTLMRAIIEEWVQANREHPVPDQIGELVRHLDAARHAATALSRQAA